MQKLKLWWGQLESGTRKTFLFLAAFVLVVLAYFFGRDVWNEGYLWQFEGKYTLLLVVFIAAVLWLLLYKSKHSQGK